MAESQINLKKNLSNVFTKGCDFMTANGSELFYWHTNKEWYKINIEEGYCELTEKAPPEAIESFKEWNKITKLGRIKEEKNES